MSHDHADEMPSIVVTTSVLTFAGSVAGALIVLALAVMAFVAWGLSIGSAIVGIVALGLVAVVLLDLPVSATFTPTGVVRRALLRRHEIPWSSVRRVRRMRSGVMRTLRHDVKGGLVADIGGRSYLLVDRTESGTEFDEIRRILGDQADRLGVNDNLRPGRRERKNGSLLGSFLRRE